MCCLGCLGMFAPRLVLVFLWLFTNAVDRAFSSLLLPLVGIIFLPFTTLFYVLVYSTAHNGPTAAGWILVVHRLSARPRLVLVGLPRSPPHAVLPGLLTARSVPVGRQATSSSPLRRA